MIEISVVSGTYDRLPHMQRMVESVRRSIRAGVPYEVVLVDGGSDDGTIEWCKAQPDIVLIEQGELLGAIAAFNAGFAVAQGRYVVVANDDIEFIDDALTQSLVFMDSHPEAGIGALEQDRSNQSWHVSEMPAISPAGENISAYYGQVCIIPRWLGDQCEWWTVPGSRTYGGDNALSARVLEAGYQVLPIVGARIHDYIPPDALREKNNTPVPPGFNHPDTVAYLRLFPKGPHLPARWKTRDLSQRPQRILYAPIYEDSHNRPVQLEQKRGLRKALQKLGYVWEVDYISKGDILKAAQLWRPDLVVTQFHDANMFSPEQGRLLKQFCGTLVNWNGDVYDRSGDLNYIALLRHYDFQGVVNLKSAENYRRFGVKAGYWQCGYEPDGVGYEPTEDTPHHDVLLLGNGYSKQRTAFGLFLKDLDCNVGIYGDFWPAGVAYKPNLYDFRAGCRLYRASKITVGDSQWSVESPGFVSNRVFQAMAAGGAMVLHEWFANPEVVGFVDGVNIVFWKSWEEMRDKIAHYLTHEDERIKIANEGQRMALRMHSFDHRLKELQTLLAVTRTHAPEYGLDPTLTAFHQPR